MKNFEIYHQSVFDKWPIENESVQSIITSPPYWGLRKYDIPDIEVDGWKGQYGLEPSYKDYIAHTIMWAKEAYRILRNDGIFFLNIGDSYQTQSGVNASKNLEDAQKWSNLSQTAITMHIKQQDLMHKCKMLIPHRIAIALIDEGWILRNDIIWHKPNGMPESVSDRFSKKFEYIFMFVKNSKYYFDLDSIRTEYSIATYQRNKYLYQDRTGKDLGQLKGKENSYKNIQANEKGKNPGDVWAINTQPSTEKHFAMWPEKLVERMIRC